jgi:hypothetical protein
LNLAHGLLKALLAKSNGPSICSVDFAASGRRCRRALQKYVDQNPHPKDLTESKRVENSEQTALEILLVADWGLQGAGD